MIIPFELNWNPQFQDIYIYLHCIHETFCTLWPQGNCVFLTYQQSINMQWVVGMIYTIIDMQILYNELYL
jgi:hypothetical protein